MSARIIKANSRNDAQSASAFNFVDLQRRGEEIIEEAQCEAEEILAAARLQASALREQAMNEARELAAMLASTCPQPESVVNFYLL